MLENVNRKKAKCQKRKNSSKFCLNGIMKAKKKSITRSIKVESLENLETVEKLLKMPQNLFKTVRPYNIYVIAKKLLKIGLFIIWPFA